MISRSILFDGPSGSEQRLFECLGIDARDVLDPQDHAGFLETRRNGAFAGTSPGDFEFWADIYLFDLDEATLLHRISALAINDDVRIAMPDDSTADPAVFLLWSKRGLHRVRIVEDDDRFVLSSVLEDLQKQAVQDL